MRAKAACAVGVLLCMAAALATEVQRLDEDVEAIFSEVPTDVGEGVPSRGKGADSDKKSRSFLFNPHKMEHAITRIVNEKPGVYFPSQEMAPAKPHHRKKRSRKGPGIIRKPNSVTALVAKGKDKGPSVRSLNKKGAPPRSSTPVKGPGIMRKANSISTLVSTGKDKGPSRDSLKGLATPKVTPKKRTKSVKKKMAALAARQVTPKKRTKSVNKRSALARVAAASKGMIKAIVKGKALQKIARVSKGFTKAVVKSGSRSNLKKVAKTGRI